MKKIATDAMKHLPPALLTHGLIEGGKYLLHGSFFKKPAPHDKANHPGEINQTAIRRKENLPKT